jgi:hypothetical protein
MDMLTLAAKPNNAPTVIVLVADPPSATFTFVGAAASVKSGLPAMVRLTEAVCVRVPLVPVTVTAKVPTAALPAIVNVSVLEPLPPVTEVGAKLAVTPVGRLLADNATLPVKLFTGLTVIVLVAVAPCIALALVPDKPKSGFVLVGIAGNALFTRS